MDKACSTTGEKRNACKILTGKSEGKGPLGRESVYVWVILKWILEEWDRVVSTGLIWLKIGTNVESL
jgi:hypothetical protein